MAQRRVLIVEDEKLIRWSLAERLRSEGHEVIEAGTVADALTHGDSVDLAILDYSLPDGDGLRVLEALRESDPDLVAIMLTAHTSVEHVVEAMRAGAHDYLTKPFDLNVVAHRVSRALETTRLKRQLRTLTDALSRPYAVTSIIGDSEPMQRVRALVQKVAGSPGSTVLVTGESGTGKDLVAKVIHHSSLRAARPFLNITCSALPETLLESELFGHERGAFTDARQQKRGLFEQAADGTVFLDEIAEMSPALQAKFLRFLEEKTFRRVGGSGDIHVDVRIVAATNRDLDERVKAGAFRADLFYRLNVLRVELPPLRGRGDDIVALARVFAETYSREFGRSARTLAPETAALLTGYRWPGNVRELRNLMERAVLLSESAVLRPVDFDSLAAGPAPDAGSDVVLPAGGLNLEAVERALVVQALERTGGNQTKAAMLLGLHRDQIRYRIEKFGLRRDSTEG